MVELYVDQILSRPVETVTPSTEVRTVADTLIRHDVGSVVVVDDADRLEGLVTSTDIVLLVRAGTDTADVPVSEFMRTDVVTTRRSAPASEVVDAMLEHRIHHVPVVDGDEVVGMVSTMDLAAVLARQLEP
ncbi:CBS domain-containing protein [Haloarchaeobius baliensis]|uniref:CBS domain-containing protein n=1 Tax=Haloarchaeobius baliensis TaxID=1670458 RepID=UPI003F883D56